VNKLLFKIVFTVLIMFNFSSAFAVKAKMTTAFNTALNAVVGNSANLQTTTILTYPAWKFLYTNSNLQFDAFGETNLELNGYISLSLLSEVNAGYGYKCVGFVKAVTDLGSGSTANWIRGNAVRSFNLPVRGDVIATFDSTGHYDFRHVAVVLSANSNYINVIDQNWQGTGANPVGRIIIHAIPFNGTGITDADSYNIVNR
jgi:hypothetical protein